MELIGQTYVDELIALPGSLAVRVGFMAEIARRPRRGRCFVCRKRRVLYLIVVRHLGESSGTEARCAPCWGIRE